MKAAFAVLIVLGLILSIVPVTVAATAVEEDVRVLTLPANATMVFEAEPGVLKLLLFNTTVRLELEFSNGTIATVDATDVILGDAVKRATVHTLEPTEIVEFSTQATEEVEMGSGIVELSYSGGVKVVELVLEPGYSYTIEFERTKPAVFLEDVIIIDCGGWWTKIEKSVANIFDKIKNGIAKAKRIIRKHVLPIIQPILPPPTKLMIEPIFKEKHYVKIPEPKKPKKIMIIKPPHVKFKVWRSKPIADGVPRTVTVTVAQTQTVTVVPQHVQPQPQPIVGQEQPMSEQPMAGMFDLQNLASNPLAIIIIVLFIVVLIALLR